MKLSLVEIAVTVLAGCSTAVLGQLSASQIISNIQLLTSKSQALQVPAQSISILNGPLVVIGQGPIPVRLLEICSVVLELTKKFTTLLTVFLQQIISGFTDHITTTTTAISQMEGTQPITTTTDADAILNAFLEFVSVHQVLLNILIGKAGLFNTVPFIGQPIAAVLRQDESVVDVSVPYLVLQSLLFPIQA